MLSRDECPCSPGQCELLVKELLGFQSEALITAELLNVQRKEALVVVDFLSGDLAGAMFTQVFSS